MTKQTKPQADAIALDCSVIFKERDEALAMIGFSVYSDYLASDLWSWVRSKLDDPGYCMCCRSTTGLAWHHRGYDAAILVGNFSSTDHTGSIVRVCGVCHKDIHASGKKWFDLTTVDERLIELERRRLHGKFHRDDLPNGEFKFVGGF